MSFAGQGVWAPPRLSFARQACCSWLPSIVSAQPCLGSRRRHCAGRASPSVTASSLPFFSSFPLERLDPPANDAIMKEHLQSGTSWLVPMWESKALMKCAPSTEAQDGQQQRWELVRLRPMQAWAGILDANLPPVLLGLEQGAAVFTAEVSRDAAESMAVDACAQWQPVRSKGWQLSPGDAALAATSCGLLAWHRNNRFCGASGTAMVPQEGGWALHSPATKRSIYPRIDPAVITLVTCGDFLLLGRNAKWEETRYSLLAGFVSLGETLEAAVVREVFEESGVQVDSGSIEYLESQPWPFPQSLMLGFKACARHADAAVQRLDMLPSQEARNAALDSKITDDELKRHLGVQLPKTQAQASEMADVRWFHRDALRSVLDSAAGAPAAGGAAFRLPNFYSLAGRTIAAWANEVGPSGPELHNVANCVLDSGRFKYVLVRVIDREGRSKLVVRGDTRAAYHMDIFQNLKASCRRSGLEVELEPVGGGRIHHDPQERAIDIYGYSVAFGPAVHEVSAAIVQASFPLYDRVSVSYEGY